jgi:acyl-[acyl-carrier-protein] desaturase
MSNAKMVRAEVMQHMESFAQDVGDRFLKPIEKMWQPSDLLPDSSSPDFFAKIKDLQERAKELSHDFWAVLVGDLITEEALPTYESWLLGLKGFDQGGKNAWTNWIRKWTAEENRHGDTLNRYLYLSGMVDMKQIEISTQHLIADGFDIGTADDPYRNFIYTSFQEMATYYSHKRTGALAKDADNPALAKMCTVIASDELRHGKAYMAFVEKILELDPNEMMLAFEDMMRKKIVMPAHYLRETGGQISSAFVHFANAAQRLGVYTARDYITIMESLLKEWKIESIRGLDDKGERARDYLLKLPNRLTRVVNRMNPIPELNHKFSWVH